MVNKKLIITAIILSFITTISIFWYLKKVQITSAVGTELEKVVMAKVDIPAKTDIKAEMVEIKEIPKGFAHANVMVNADDVVGKLSGEPLYAGEQVLSQNLVTIGDNSKGLAFQIPKGKRALSLPVNDVSGIAGLIKPGDKVDVIATLDLDSQKNVGRVVQSSAILQNILVLAINKNLDDVGISETGAEGQTTVTLAVNPEDSTPLILASEKGMVRLTLRGHTDEEIRKIPAYKLSNFLKEGE